MKSIRLILTVLAIMSVASCGKDNGSAMPDNGKRGRQIIIRVPICSMAIN